MVTNICLKCITFINLTFLMLQHTSSEVIIIQLQINLIQKYNCTDWELTRLIDIKRQENANNRFYGIFKVTIIFQNTRRIKSFFPDKDKLAPSFRSKVVYKANCWDCNDFHIGKTKRRLRDRKTDHFKALTTNCHESAIADHVFLTNHRITWDHFEILATGRSDMHCKMKESVYP